MFHSKRRWVVSPVASAEELACKLTHSTWTLCTGFYVEGHPNYLFLNDATSEDGAAEFGVVHVLGASEWLQVESITFSWTNEFEALDYIRAALAGQCDANGFARKIDLAGRLDTPEEHGQRYCRLCA